LKRRVEVLAAARRDLTRLEDFLATKSPRAATRAAHAISRTVLSLAEMAERGRLDPDGALRELVVRFGRDGYVIQYAIRGDRVLVARILHAREAR
jgi:plasmid stabilization system protein ParE